MGWGGRVKWEVPFPASYGLHSRFLFVQGSEFISQCLQLWVVSSSIDVFTQGRRSPRGRDTKHQKDSANERDSTTQVGLSTT